MPVLAANQVTLTEVLEVKGAPLNEEEIWAVLSLAGKDIEHVLAEGRGKQFGQPSLVISPDTLILSHCGHVKVSTHVAREKSKNPTYRAPELNSRTVSPSDGAVEKMYVYSLGMTVYHAAEYSLKKSKMSHLSVSLGNLLLSMCEELARSRYSLRQVLAACGSKYGDSFYSKIIKGLVVLVLGSNIPEVVQCNDVDRERSLARGYSSDDQHPSLSLRARYRRSLELPSPPLVHRASRGQVTSEELIGSNDRTMTSPKEQPGYHSKNKYITKIPHTLDKYRKYLEKARHQKTVTSPIVADRSIDLRHRYGSMPVINGRHSLELSSRRGYDRTQSLDRDDKGFEEASVDNGWLRSRSAKLKGAGSGSLGNLHTAPSSDASSETSSLSDNHPKSTLSSAQSSSLVSLMEGSYVPASSLTDLGSDYWGSMASLRGVGGSQRSEEWHHSSIGDLRSVSQLSSHDRAGGKNGFPDLKPQWPSNSVQRKYRSEQNLVSPDATDGVRKAKKVPKAKLRKFFGPEFVQVLEDPNQSLVNITPKKAGKPISGRRLVTVVMLNEQRLEMSVESSTKVQELFTQITKYVGITEKIYFGLTRIEDDEHLFLDFDTKLSKYAPAGWKEQSKTFAGKYVLYFRVKFYVGNLALFRHHETSHQLYLQLRSDIIKDHVYTDVDPVLNLASLALQAEYGDYNKKRFGESYFKPKHYLPHRILVKLSEEHVSQKLRALHKLQCGLSQEEAEVKFIKEAQKLSEYGMHLYKAEWSKKENQIIYLGICVRGVTIFELRQNKRKPLEKHAWPTIKKLAFKKKKFYIEPRKEETKSKQNRLTFVSSSYKRSKYLLYLCTSFHRFQMRMKVRLLAMEETSTVPDERKRNSLGPGYDPGNPRPHLNGASEDGRKLVNGNEHVNDVDTIFESRDPSRASSANGVDPTGPEGGASPPYVLNSTPTSPAGYSDKTPSPRANQKKTAEMIMSPDRKIKLIKLKKDARGTLGLTVVGGEDTRRLHYGIFIKRISPGSIAHEDGRLQVGDRILAVNGKSLEYVSHDEAVQTLKNTPVDVELLVSQSTRTDSDIDMSTMSSPAVDETERPSSSHEYRMSPYLVEELSPAVKINSNHNNSDVISTNVARDLESAYPEDTENPLENNSPQSPRSISGRSSDMPASNPSSPEQWTRRNHHGGIKLPGMTDGQLEGVKLVRNSQIRTSRSSQVSDESPGSIASFREKVNRQNSLPYFEMQNHDRKSSVGSAISNGRLGRSRSNSATTPAEVGSERTREDGHGILVNDIISGLARNGSVLEFVQPCSESDQVHVGIVRDTAERRRSQEDKGPTHFTVELDKVSGSLGLNVMGGKNTNVPDGAIFVKSLFPNGAADLDGRIQVGHKILSVNGISLQGVTHRQAVETIKRAPVHAVFVIEGIPGESLDHIDDRSHKQETVFQVVLTKGIGGLGMSLVGGTDYGEEYGDELRIKAMFPGQPAENSEKLRLGDIILAANGVPLVGKTSRDAINVLRDQPTRVVLTVKRDPASIPPGLLRRGSFSQSLDPNEILSAIDSKLERDDSRRSESRPGNEESSSLEIREAHNSASRRSSNTKGDNGGILQDRNELYLEEAGTNADNGSKVHGSTSQDKIRTYSDTSAVLDDDSGLKSVAIHSSMENNHRGYGPGTATVETVRNSTLVTLSENDLIPGTHFLGLSSDSMSDDHIVEIDELEHELKNRDLQGSTQLVKEDVLSPLEGRGNISPTGGGVGDENRKKRRKSSSGRLFQAEKEKLAPDEEVLDIILHKGSSGLGFTLAGGADTVGGCFVREIIGDPARSDGRLRPKDQIVMVNGQDTTSKKHMEAVNILRSTRNEVHLVIRRRPDKVKGKTEDGLNIKTISVIRTTRGLLGLTLAEDKQGQIYAAEVIPDEPAAKDGGLKRGDIILEINGERVDDTGLMFATECLDRARPVVTLVIKQYRSETESKYVLCSPTESDHEIATESSRDHASAYNIRTVVQPDYRTEDQKRSNNLEFSISDKPSPDNLPSSFMSPEHPSPELLSSENIPSEEPSNELVLSQPLNDSLEPAQRNYVDKQVKGSMESLSAANSYSQEMTTPSATERPGNEDYPSDDDDLLFKEEIITTALHKGLRGLGFSLFSGQTVHDTSGLFIRSIQPNSVVEEDGKIKVGDQLLKVNGEDVERLNHSEVITLLRSLSGVIKLELLRVHDAGDDDDEPLTSSPRKPDVSNETRDTDQAEAVNTSVTPVTTPDFTEDVGIVLNALHTKHDLPLSDGNNQDSLPSPAEKRPSQETSEEQINAERSLNQCIDSEDERNDSWPQPPTSLELQSNDVLNELTENMPQISNITENTRESNIDDLNPVEMKDDQVATSEDDTTSVTFSEDDFLDEIEDLSYTPSPESDRKRSGNIFEISRIPVKPGSSLSQNISPRASEQIYSPLKKPSKEENIEMSLLSTDKSAEHSRISIDNTMPETNLNLPEGSISPLIPESFLNASQAVSSSQTTTPEVPPLLPTTPLPSDEDLGGNAGQKVSPRDHTGQVMTMRERFEKVVKQENVTKGRFDYPLRPHSPLISRRSKSVQPSGPLVEVQVPSTLFSGQRLQKKIEELQLTISSGKAANEFQALREMTPVDNCPSGKRAINKEKNRYRNVLPYEKTRVILSGDEHMDYINANYINIHVGSETYHYIATQGPLPVTTNDFWRMVWEQKCEAIAMVTLDMESGKVKCHRYWPESPELPVKVSPSLDVHLESVETQRNLVERNIRIDNTEQEQSLEIVHLNFVAWPDHGVPKSACELVEFIKQFRTRTSVGPFVIHCSAGIGRTGTLLTIDTCMKHIERGIEFEIYSIVHNLREQRPGMIQTKDQYLFCYQACVEILKSLQS